MNSETMSKKMDNFSPPRILSRGKTWHVNCIKTESGLGDFDRDVLKGYREVP